MEELKLGPNGGLVYCMEFLRDAIDQEPFPFFTYLSNFFLLTYSSGALLEMSCTVC
jgi:hypothetical protein